MHTLMYHDVYLDASTHRTSGFGGSDAGIYKLPRSVFEAHLDQLAASLESPPSLLISSEIEFTDPPEPGAWALTFDDGGSSAFDIIAPALEDRGWRGHFFISTSQIGKPGFLDALQIRILHERGHCIGAHSHTHPPRMSALDPGGISREWETSIDLLSKIIGCRVVVASVPGGYYSKSVGVAAAKSGIRFLFTSEPISRLKILEGFNCTLLGRYAIKSNTLASTSAGFASGHFLPRFGMWTAWALRAIAKRLGGKYYVHLRSLFLNR